MHKGNILTLLSSPNPAGERSTTSTSEGFAVGAARLIVARARVTRVVAIVNFIVKLKIERIARLSGRYCVASEERSCFAEKA